MLFSRAQKIGRTGTEAASQAGASPAGSQPQFAADYAARYRRAHYTKSIYLIGWLGAFPAWLIATNAYSKSRAAVLVILLSSIALAVVAFVQYLKHRKIAKQRYAEWQDFETNRLYPTALRALSAVEPAPIAAKQETESAGQEIARPNVELPSSADIVSRHNRARIAKYLCLIAGIGAFPAWIVVANLYAEVPAATVFTLLMGLTLAIVSFRAFGKYRTLARKLLVERQIVEARRGDAAARGCPQARQKERLLDDRAVRVILHRFLGKFHSPGLCRDSTDRAADMRLRLCQAKNDRPPISPPVAPRSGRTERPHRPVKDKTGAAASRLSPFVRR